MKPLCQRELDAAAESGKSLSLSLSHSLSPSLLLYNCVLSQKHQEPCLPDDEN